RREVVEDAAPVALVVGAAAVAFVDHNEIEEVGRILTEVWGLRAILGLAHEGLEDGEEYAAVLGDLALFADLLRTDAHHRVFWKRGKFDVGLIGQDVAIGKKQN